MTKREGESEREIEFSERVCRRGMEETWGNHNEHKVNSNQIVTKFSSKNYCLMFSYKSPFIEYGDGE